MDLINNYKVKFIKLYKDRILKIKNITSVRIRLDSKDIRNEKHIYFILYFCIKENITEVSFKVKKEIFKTYKEDFSKTDNKYIIEQKYVEELRNTTFYILNNIKIFNEDIKEKMFEEILEDQLSLMSSKDIKV